MLKARIACGVLAMMTVVMAQTPSGAPTFDVANLKLNTTSTARASGSIVDGEIHVINLPLLSLVEQAWNLRPEQISGAPSWTLSDHYDLAAKASVPTTPVPDLRVMLQNLLIERFHMTTHMSEAEHDAFVLTIEPGGAEKLGPSVPETPEMIVQEGCKPGSAPESGRDVVCYVSMQQLALALPAIAPGYFSHTTVDQTGLSGVYQIELKFVGANSDTPGPSIFDALKDLGVRVQNKKVALPQLTIDHMERTPTGN